MKRRHLLHGLGLAALGLNVPALAQAPTSTARVPGPILLVTSREMNGQTSDPRINAFLESQVLAFATAAKDVLIQQGLAADLADISADTGDVQQALVRRLRAGATRYEYLGQIFWNADDKDQVHIHALFGPLNYSADAVKFADTGEARFKERRYFLFGPGRASERTVEQEARAFVQGLQLLGAVAPARGARSSTRSG